MPKIEILTEELINKIAAGEVIERPASVVKELIENSLDAKATKITIELQDSGKKLIKVTDNGEGMDENDAKQSILRHATSKIKTTEDLFSIQTLGFRGEALASIAAVSQLSIITKQQDKLEGFNLVVENNKVISSGILAAETGTTIEVRNLFFNTPARQKFMKTDAVELRHLVDVVTRYALINEKVHFHLIHENHTLLQSPTTDNMLNNIAAIYGLNIAKDLIEINYSIVGIKVSGYISKPYHVRNDKNHQSIFVNGRWVKNEEVSKAIYDAYHSLLFVNKHPVAILFLELDSNRIDVNVHPNKLTIKFEQNEEVYIAVTKAIKETLQKNNLVPVVDVDTEQQLAFGGQVKYGFEETKQTVLEVEKDEETESREGLVDKESRAATSTSETNQPSLTAESKETVIPQAEIYSKMPPIKLLGQIHKTFFVGEIEGGVVFIDQHAAHERVLYEEFMQQFMSEDVKVQTLLQGDLIEFSPTDCLLIEDNLKEFNKFGFTLEHFGENAFLIKTIPSVFGRTQPKELLHDLLSRLKEGKDKLSDIKEEIITRMACRAAVMGGEELTNERMQKILEELGRTELPYTCPHGRPTIIKTEAEELEKKFKRK